MDKVMGAADASEVEKVLEEVKKDKESRDQVQLMMRDEGHVALDIGDGLCVLGKPEVCLSMLSKETCSKDLPYTKSPEKRPHRLC